MAETTRLAILISGSGRTMVNLQERIGAGTLDAEIVHVISSRSDAVGVNRARDLGLPVDVIMRRDYVTAEEFSKAIWQLIDRDQPDLICLAGFLSLLIIPDRYLGRVMNIHPALLPRHGGKGMYGRRVHEAVLAAGDTESGCTVHLADNQYDRGPIVLQRRCPVLENDTAESLAARVFVQECEAYPEAIEMFQRGELEPLVRSLD
ncbi:MAG: phosphoribosylglycinamide formyltransferase [Phycisphaeraceae bacterium]|nr:phosphoribosylglycinamide formyltransferase [Phycisphaeraceae bacterium]